MSAMFTESSSSSRDTFVNTSRDFGANVTAYYDPRSLNADAAKRASLHAKCIVIDREAAFVSSANFTEAAQVRNIEVGVLIRSPGFAVKLARHFETLAAEGILRRLPGSSP
jgi:phosphatidylserine/phosphatidylglycerophosphate/cardiolipin synthase-like enzyme